MTRPMSWGDLEDPPSSSAKRWLLTALEHQYPWTTKRSFLRSLGYAHPGSSSKWWWMSQSQQVDIYVDHEPDIRVRCPVCDQFYGLYDHAPERVYRHLDTCQMRTFIHVRLPRVNCPTHGIKQVGPEFGENGSELTFAFESFVIRVAQECSIQATARLCRLGWDQCWNTLERAVDRGRAP